jgi:hypothetical protein
MEEPMSTKIEIPAEAIPDVRQALLCRVGDAAETIATVVARRDRELHPEWLAPGRDLFEHACELLDLIGWDGTLRPQSTLVDRGEHWTTLMTALERYLPLVERGLAGVEVNDARHAGLGERPGRQAVKRRGGAARVCHARRNDAASARQPISHRCRPHNPKVAP